MSVSSVVSSTPIKKRTSSIDPDVKATRNTVDPLLHSDIEANIFSGVSIQDFVAHVWGVDTERSENILARTWQVQSLPDFATYSAVASEKELYAPFGRIAEQLVAQLWGNFRKDQQEADIRFWNERGEIALKGRNERKPDMVTFWRGVTEKAPHWMLARHFLEFKALDKVTPPVKSGLEAIPEDEDDRKSETYGVGSRTTGGSNRRTTRTAEAEVAATSSVGSKRKRINDDMVSSSSKRAKGSEGDNEVAHSIGKSSLVQLASYALESMITASRVYASGLLVDRFKVSLWYFDRACIISSLTFRWDEEPAKLALVIYALSICDDRRAGYDPHLALEPKLKVTKAATRMTPQETSKILHLPGSVISYAGLPILKVEKLIYAYTGLIGRGTMVYGVSRRDNPGRKHEALKVSWPLKTRSLEGEIVRRLTEKMPGWKRHLPQIEQFLTRTAEELGLPRVELLKLIATKEGFADRLLHVLLMREYKKLWEVDSVEEFQEVFVDCLECHYHAFNSGVLHRDLSENNLMFDRRDEGGVDGVLNDWDMASLLNDLGEVPATNAPHRTGTPRFMAYDLLMSKPPTHLYRHDLESFFYILVWATLHYDIDNKRKVDAIIPVVADWDSEFTPAYKAKKLFLQDRVESRAIFAAVRPEFQGVLKQWVKPLWKLFSKALKETPSDSSDDEDHGAPQYDYRTLGGHITFHKFMAAIGREERGLNPSPKK